MNGYPNNNFFEGPVFIDGDTDIDGNLTVTGTYPSGGGGSVNNPMTSNLDANNYQINNVAQITAGIYPQILMSEINLQNNTIRGVNQIEVNELYSSTGQIYLSSGLDAKDNGIFNISELTSGEEGFIRTSTLDLQDHDIININEIKGNSAENILYLSANVEMFENLNMTDKSIINLSELKAGDTGIISIIGVVDFKDHNLVGVDTLAIDRLTTNHPSITAIECDNKSLVDLNNIQTQGISSSTGFVAVNSVLNMFNDINMSYNEIFNVERLTGSHASVNLNLDLIPATEGKAGQVLARDPAFDPANPATRKLVWTNQSSGGGITNPLTANLQGAGYSIFDTNIIESKSINIMLSGGGLACANGAFAVPITWGLAQKLSLAPFYQTFNTDYITPATNLGIVIDSKAPDGITDSKITLSAPNIILNNSTNLTPSLVSITGNLQITNGSGYIHGNNLIVRGRTAGNTPTNLTLEGITTSINSTTLNITSNANVIVGNTNFTATVRTNTIDANSGGNISVLQNLTLATGRQVRTPLLFTDALRSNTATDLYIAGLLPDNKTQTNIIISAPQISLDNQFGPLVPDTQVNISGSLIFNNPASTPFIQGSNLIIRGRTPANIATQLTLEGTTTTISSSTLNIFSSLANNIGGPTDFADITTFQEKPNFISGIKSNILDSYTGNNISCLHNLTLSTGKELKTPTTTTDTINVYTGTSLNINATDTNISNRLNVLTNRSPSIGVRTTLYKTFGPMPSVNINVVLPTPPAILNTPIANQKGDYIMPPNGFVNGDKFILTMYGLLTTVGSGSLGVYLLIGSVPAVNFGVINVTSSNQPCKFTFEIDCTVSGNNVDLANGTALLSVERFNTSIRFSVGTIGSLVPNNGLSNSFNIALAQSASQVSSFTPLSYTIEQM